MALRDILTLPDPRLRLVSDPVKAIDAETRKLAEDMFETMYAAPGIGLAAIQVGVPQRVVTLDLAKKDEPPQPQVFINPEITWYSEEKGDLRGRLPVDPGILRRGRAAGAGESEVSRSRRESRSEIEADGLLATCIQHEIDHLNGVLFIDHISKLKRDRVTKKFAKAAKLTAAPPSRVAKRKSPHAYGIAILRDGRFAPPQDEVLFSWPHGAAER